MKNLLTVSLLILTACVTNLWGQFPEVLNDNFDDNNIDGWRFVDPIGEITSVPHASFSVSDGQVRIVAPATPDAQFGVGRAAMGFESIVMSDFEVSVDVNSSSDKLNSGLGIGARAREGGAGTSDGYFAGVGVGSLESPRLGLAITRMDDEIPTPLTAPVPFDAENGYRLEFRGEGNILVASAFDLNEPATLLATVSANDDVYSAGFPWLFTSGGFDAMGEPDVASSGDATFDNYRASGTLVPEPSHMTSIALATFGLLALRRRKSGINSW